MSFPFWCVFVGALLPYVWGGYSSFLRKQQFGSLDNRHPRAQQAALTGAGARAYAAHANAWEAIAMFAPAVILAHLSAPSSTLATPLAAGWLGLRVMHGVAYVADLATLRSAIFALAFTCSACLYLVAAHVL